MPMTLFEKFRSRHFAIPAVVLALGLAAACGGALGDAVDAGCSGLEVIPGRDGQISQSEAERLAIELLAMPAPEVSGAEIERVWASCLTTLRSYEQDLLSRTNPGMQPLNTPVWIVEVRGVSRPAGISAANAGDPYLYALAVINAETGDTIAGSRRRDPIMEPAGGIDQ